MAEPTFGCYVYCVVRAAERPALEGLAGVEPASGVGVVTHGGLSALVSRVRLEEFGADALRRNLEDLAWVERTARAHDAVLARALTVDAVVPLRLCTIFADEARVREMLGREQEPLLEALERLSGHAEWSVKLLADPRKLEAAARERIPAATATPAPEGESPGHAFFARRKLERELRDEAHALAEAAAADAHERLRERAAAATLLPPQHPDLSRRSGQMVLNGAYLVHRSRAEEFATVAREFDERRRAMGLQVELSGPWAPYNFVAATEERHE